jgi:transposase
MAERYAGIDWASEAHDVLVADEDGVEVLAATFAHDEKGLSGLCRVLVRLEVGLVAIERPDGLLVERLLDAGLRVLPLHPNKVAAARDRFRVSRGKSDRFDAFVLCELARTDRHRFRVLEPDGDRTKAIRALTRARQDLVAARTAVMNQLRAELERFWPGPLRLFSHMDAEILLAFLERYPSPADAHGLGVARMQAFLVRERYSGGQHPTALMAKLRSAPRGRVGELELAAHRQLVLTFVQMIRTLNVQIKDLEREIRGQVRAHPDGVNAQREIELGVREQLEAGKFRGEETLEATATIVVSGLPRDLSCRDDRADLICRVGAGSEHPCDRLGNETAIH